MGLIYENSERIPLGSIPALHLLTLAADTPPNPPAEGTAAGCLRNYYQIDVGDSIVVYGKELELVLTFGGSNPYDQAEIAAFYSSVNPAQYNYGQTNPTDVWRSAGTQVAYRSPNADGGNSLIWTPNGCRLVTFRVKATSGGSSTPTLRGDLYMVTERARGEQ